jgi:hypothetical protein
MSDTKNVRHNFKEIILANWNQPDDQTALWMQMTAVAKDVEQWLVFFMRPQCSAKVPDDLVEMLEVARGVMIYSMLFYPMATTGAEQCYRILDTGARVRCQQLGISTKVVTKSGWERDTRFHENLDELLKSGHFTQPHRERWDAVRRLRNSTSHPERQMILDPGQAQGQLELAVEFLNELFG